MDNDNEEYQEINETIEQNNVDLDFPMEDVENDTESEGDQNLDEEESRGESDLSLNDSLRESDLSINENEVSQQKQAGKQSSVDKTPQQQRFELMLHWGNEFLPLHLELNATFKNLKELIYQKTNVKPYEQELHGLPLKDMLQDELPLAALGLEKMHSILLQKNLSAIPPPIEGDGETPDYRSIFGGNKGLNVDHFSIVLDDAAVDAAEFTATFEEQYGMTHPLFTGGKYSEVSKIAKSNFQLMIVNIHADYEENITFSRDTLTSSELANFLAEHFIFWVGFMDQQKVKDFSNLFGIPIKLPFLALLGYIDGSMSVLDVIQGQVTPDEFMAKCWTCIDTYQPILEKARKSAEVSNLQRMLMEEQNMAFKRSLQEDMEKERIKREETMQKEQERNDKKAIVAEARKSALDRFSELPPEPKTGAATIAINLPDGSRIQRKWSIDTKLKSIFEFIEGTVAFRLDDETFLDDCTPSLENEQVKPWTIKRYELVSNYPKRTYNAVQDVDKSLKELGLVSQSLLFLHPAK